jgi:rubrerythrin
MKSGNRRGFFRFATQLITALSIAPWVAHSAPAQLYVCPPCGCSMDKKEFTQPGKCPACGMTLTAKPAAAKSTS